MKTSTIKNHAGQKMLIVNNIESVDVKALYLQARSMRIAFGVKIDGLIQQWGLFTVCEYLGIKDHSTLAN